MLEKEASISMTFATRNDLTNALRITYGIECYLPRSGLPAIMKHISKHRLLSVSVCINFLGHELPVCFVTRGDSLECTGRFVTRITTMANVAC